MQPLHIVSAFGNGRFGSGNLAAVLALPGPVPDGWLQAVAGELGLPATAYVWPEVDGRLPLRWFTPRSELPSCGHATLAAAHVVLARDEPRAEAVFATSLGDLPVARRGDRIVLRMPAVTVERWQLPDWAVSALGVEPVEVWRSDRHALVRVAGEADVRNLLPDLRALAALPVVGIAVTAPGSGYYDIVSRWFVPSVEHEDQATGTAHCVVGPYWAGATGSESLRAYQASTRGGEFELTVSGGYVAMAGRATTRVRGHLIEDIP